MRTTPLIRLLSLLLALCLLPAAGLAEPEPESVTDGEAAPDALSDYFSVPETPPGMTAHDAGGFVFFVPEDWEEAEPETPSDGLWLASRSFRPVREEEDGLSLEVLYIDTAEKEMNPVPFMMSVFIGMAMSSDAEDLEKVTWATIRLRGSFGLLALNPDSILWMGTHGTTAVFLALSGGTMDERQALLFRVLGVTEDEAVVDVIDPS